MNNYVELGQTLYFQPLCGLIIPVKVLEIQDIHVASDEVQKANNLSSSTLWVRYDAEGAHCTGYIAETKENPWGFNDLNPDIINGSERVNQFIWIDEPVGHSVQVGDEVFLTIQDALEYVECAPRRNRLRPHKKLDSWRRRSLGFINWTRRNAEVIECSMDWEPKKIWVKRRY